MSIDIDQNALFAAVGRALNSWETLEADFSYLYSIFKQRPMDIETLIEYGRESRTFQCRMAALKTQAESFFIGCPSQEREGMFSALLKEADNLVISRNQIAHGIVYQIPAHVRHSDSSSTVQPGYVTVPPWHWADRAENRAGHYHYGSREIGGFELKFRALGERVAAFNKLFFPDAPDF